MPAARSPLTRDFFDRPAVEVAPDLLGRVLVAHHPEGTVELRLTEVEAYAGSADPASHAFRGPTPRNAVMFGEPGHVYVYFTYGMHFCMNLVAGPGPTASAVLLRAGEVVSGQDLARSRRGTPRRDADLARGPARLTLALGVDRALDGADACSAGTPFRVLNGTPPAPALISQGPRTGVAQGAESPWRFWITGDPTVSPYRRHAPRKNRVARSA
ncbi:DNA-3-methyladenine glycosylase [Streptacidiphilus sp. MAP12-16]|uniref:DNA-3-methyladenine glycosylase n=1 Tax=Streptacidiphilus sp. MAP12-16 TaxID=3156300 RepID=UPI003515893F